LGIKSKLPKLAHSIRRKRAKRSAAIRNNRSVTRELTQPCLKLGEWEGQRTWQMIFVKLRGGPHIDQNRILVAKTPHQGVPVNGLQSITLFEKFTGELLQRSHVFGGNGLQLHHQLRNIRPSERVVNVNPIALCLNKVRAFQRLQMMRGIGYGLSHLTRQNLNRARCLCKQLQNL
jgi:hypothetical protein